MTLNAINDKQCSRSFNSIGECEWHLQAADHKNRMQNVSLLPLSFFCVDFFFFFKVLSIPVVAMVVNDRRDNRNFIRKKTFYGLLFIEIQNLAIFREKREKNIVWIVTTMITFCVLWSVQTWLHYYRAQEFFIRLSNVVVGQTIGLIFVCIFYFFFFVRNDFTHERENVLKNKKRIFLGEHFSHRAAFYWPMNHKYIYRIFGTHHFYFCSFYYRWIAFFTSKTLFCCIFMGFFHFNFDKFYHFSIMLLSFFFGFFPLSHTLFFLFFICRTRLRRVKKYK